VLRVQGTPWTEKNLFFNFHWKTSVVHVGIFFQKDLILY